MWPPDRHEYLDGHLHSILDMQRQRAKGGLMKRQTNNYIDHRARGANSVTKKNTLSTLNYIV